jgi:hypothetical protein
VCVGIETVEAFIGVTAGIELVATGPVAGVGKITSWKNMNRVGIENVPPPDDEPPEFMVMVTVDVAPVPEVGDALPVVVPIVLVGIETCMAGVGAIGVGIIGAGAIVPMPGHSNSRPSSDSTEIEGFRRARRAFIACRFCSCWDLMVCSFVNCHRAVESHTVLESGTSHSVTNQFGLGSVRQNVLRE